MTIRHGATPEDWALFDLCLGMGSELLPIVCDPTIDISPKSNVKRTSVGKVPSVLNRSGQLIGYTKWTEVKATPAQVAKWSSWPYTGFGLQTRFHPGIDIDVPDVEKADEIVAAIDEYLGFKLPMRWRADSGKVLLFYAMPAGSGAKRSCTVDGGKIEFLGRGNQFAICTRHPDGERYQIDWRDGHRELDLEQHEAIWEIVNVLFRTTGSSDGVGALSVRRSGLSSAKHDPVADYIEESGRALGYGPDNSTFLECPWKTGHSSDSGISEACWLRAGSLGYEQGHFKCLHNHCLGRTDQEFKEAIGFIAADFDELPVLAAPPAVVRADGVSVAGEAFAGGKLLRDAQALIKSSLPNLKYFLRFPDVCGFDLALDDFQDEILIRHRGEKWRAIEDADYVEMRTELEVKGFQPVSESMMWDSVLAHARRNRFDSAIAWLKHDVPEWDGVSRVETFVSEYFGAEDNEYTRAVGLYMWTAMAGRCLVPGIQADMVPILQGAQGIFKTSIIAELVPYRKNFCGVKFTDREDDMIRKMKGCLVGEIGEMAGARSKKLEDIKEFVTRRDEKWVKKYIESATLYPRRIFFIGTTNKDELFFDETGNRRWLPVEVVRHANMDDLKRDRLQLWAEGRELFGLFGVAWQDAQRLAPAEHEKFRVTDGAWEGAVARWMTTADEVDGVTPVERGFRIEEALENAIGKSLASIDPEKDYGRMRRCLKVIGLQNRVTKKVNGSTERRWRFHGTQVEQKVTDLRAKVT